MATPKDAEHGDAADEGRHIFECRQECLDVVRDLLRGDHQHRNGKRERCVDESFQPRHLHPAQPKPVKPRQPIEVCRQRLRDFLMPLGHRSSILFRNPASALLLSTSYFFIPTFLARAPDPENRKAATAFMRLGGFSNLTFYPLLSSYPIPRESSVGWSIAAVVVSPLSAW